MLSVGIMEDWNIGVLEDWDDGVLEGCVMPDLGSRAAINPDAPAPMP
jgi:hypothetical protein